MLWYYLIACVLLTAAVGLLATWGLHALGVPCWYLGNGALACHLLFD